MGGSDYDPLHSDRIITQPVSVKLQLTPDQIELLEIKCMTLQMTLSQYVTRLVRGSM